MTQDHSSVTVVSERPIQFQGNRLAAWLLKRLGWTLYFDGLPGPHGVMVVYPHTSNWDFFIGLLAKWAMGLQIQFLAKDSLFKIPLVGAWLRYLGGIAVVRSSPQGYVQDMASSMLARDYAWVVITPEGTRQRTPGWRSGFYRLATLANIPVGLAFIDYRHKEIGVKHFIQLSQNEDLDLDRIRQEYAERAGFHPEDAAPITFWTPRS